MLDQLRTLGEATEIADVLDTVYVDRPGHRQGPQPSGLRRRGQEAGRPAAGHRAGQHRRLGRLLPRHGRDAAAGQSDYVLLHGRRHQARSPRASCGRRRSPTWPAGRRSSAAHMFSMYDRSLLHAFAEAIGPQQWWWGAAPNTKGRHDFARRNLRNTPWLHRRADSDYNGWWMCLIPTRVDQRDRPGPAGVHQVGRRRVRRAGPRGGLPDRVHARRGRMARAVG